MMETNNNYPGPGEEWEDPANQDDFPKTDDLNIDLENDHSEETPDGDDVDLDRAE